MLVETLQFHCEEGNARDVASSLPPYRLREAALPAMQRQGARCIVLAEEWRTVDVVLHLDWRRRQGRQSTLETPDGALATLRRRHPHSGRRAIVPYQFPARRRGR